MDRATTLVLALAAALRELERGSLDPLRAELAVRRIAEAGLDRAVPALLPACVARAWSPVAPASRAHDAIADSAQAMISSFASTARPDAWLTLDAHVRGEPRWAAARPLVDHWRRWRNLDARAAERASATSDPPWIVDAMLTMHPDGRLREIAIVRLSTARDPRVLPFLLVRCVDWVRAVRERATAAALALVDRVGVEAIESLPLVVRLAGFRRADVRPLVARVIDRLASEPDALAERAARSPDPRVRAIAIDSLAERGLASVDRVERFLEDRDPAVQVRMARVVEEWAHRPDARLPAIAARMVAARSAAVRASGLRISIRILGADVRPHLVAHLDDRHREVRWIATSELLAREPGFDLRGHLVALVRERPTPGAIEHLADLRHAEDWEALVPLLDGHRAEVARAALRAIRRLAPSESRELRLMLVDDPRPSVSREAAGSMRADLWAADEPIVTAWLVSTATHVRRHAVQLAPWLPGGAGLRVLARNRDPGLAPRVARAVVAFLTSRMYVMPELAPDEREAVVRIVEAALHGDARARALAALGRSR